MDSKQDTPASSSTNPQVQSKRLLDILNRTDDWLPNDELARRMGTNQKSIVRLLKMLREQGHEIEREFCVCLLPERRGKPRWEKKIVAVRVAHCWHQARQWRKEAGDRGHYGYLPQMCNGAHYVEVLVETTSPITGRTALIVASRITDGMMERGEWPGQAWPASCEACREIVEAST